MAVIPSEPSTAFWILSNTLRDLHSWAEHPDPQTLGGDWLQAYKDRIRSQSRSAIVSIETLGDAALAAKIKDAERLAVRFATLLCDNPTLSTVPVQDWNVARFRELFDELGKSEELFKRLAKPEDTASKTEAQPITGVTKPEASQSSTTGKSKRPTVNARMIDTLCKRPEAKDWTVTQWREHLGGKTGRATIHGTNTWKELEKMRTATKTTRLDRDSSRGDHGRRKAKLS